jgi:hypothetical protein
MSHFATTDVSVYQRDEAVCSEYFLLGDVLLIIKVEVKWKGK